MARKLVHSRPKALLLLPPLLLALVLGLSGVLDWHVAEPAVQPETAAASVASQPVQAPQPDLSAHADPPLEQAPAFVSGLMPAPWADRPVLRDDHAPFPWVDAIAAVVVDEASAAVLYDKEAHVGRPPASLTKIVTLILALEHGDLDETVTTDVDSSAMRGSTVMGLMPGDQFSLRDLLHGLMLPSGNDAALAIGRHVSGSDPAFVAQMNLLLARLGLTESHFANPHGLGNNSHYTSPYDLAMLSRYGMSLPGFYDVVNTRVWVARGSRTLAFSNINGFINSYRGADGVKTGYTRSAGPTLVASATRNGHRLYAVVLNAPGRDFDATILLNWAFANHTWP